MVINPTQFAKAAATSASWPIARQRVISSYREWVRAAPEIQKLYGVNIPVAKLRTKIRSEFEKNRFVAQLPVVDVLIQRSHAEYQETMNYWKQTSHIMKYFRTEEDPTSKRPADFMQAFLEGRN